MQPTYIKIILKKPDWPKENIMKLTKEINNQPIINLNEVNRRARCKEDKLPRKLRAGWKL